ncbi:NADP-dependent oxidoreductase domain-containing protein [Aspergillus filifer]
MAFPTLKPRAILGLMTTGPPTAHGARITSLLQFQQLLIQSSGYIELDTARIYLGGSQESFTAEAGYKERGLSIATKVYPLTPGDHAPEALSETLNLSLRELDTDAVDIFYLHAPDRSVPFETTLEEVDKLYREGKFKQLGLSNYASFEVAEICTICRERGWVRPTIYQALYNALIRTIEPELIPACRHYGLDIVVYNAIAGGMLVGIYKAPSVPETGRFSAQHPTGQTYRDRYFKKTTFTALQIIETAASKHGLTMPECAFRWLRHHSALRFAADNGSGEKWNDGVVISVSSVEQLERNLADLEKGPLPGDVVEAMEEAWTLTKGEAVKYWHGKLEFGYDTPETLFEKE